MSMNLLCAHTENVFGCYSHFLKAFKDLLKAVPI